MISPMTMSILSSKPLRIAFRAACETRSFWISRPNACPTGLVRSKIRELKVADIQLIPRIPFKKLPEIFHTSSIYVHTAPTEPFGLAIVEAMASSLPVIVPSAGGADEVAGYAGLRFQPDNPEDLAEKIITLMDDRDEYCRQSELSYKRSKEFSWEKASVKYCEIYQKLTE